MPDNTHPVGKNILIIENAQLENSGEYSCHGYLFDEQVYVEVIGKVFC